jgi:hypothetical protein
MNEQHEEICEWLELYALKGLSEMENKQFETHLVECPACREKLIELENMTDLLPLASEQIDVPVGMKERVLGHVLNSGNPAQDSRMVSPPYNKPAISRRFFMNGLSAAAVILLVISSFLYVDNRNLEQELAEREELVDRLQLALSDMTGPVEEPIQPTVIVTLNPEAEDIVSKGLASIVIDQRGTHLLVMAEDLPELEGEQAFQVWLLDEGTPRNAGTFLAHQGTGAFYYTIESDRYDRVVITVEPDAHGSMPRGYAILSAKI